MTNANEHYGSHNGSEHIYTVRPFPITFTQGVKDMIENCAAYWLIDIIISFQTKKAINRERFQVWELKRYKKDAFYLDATNGNNIHLGNQYIPFSDFPFDKATIWLVNDTLLLPHEY